MQTIGERLEEARKRKGVSIREAAEATKIRGDYLQKFESNQFDLGLAELYVRGFLRSYAQFLKLPADKIVNDFNGLGHGATARPRAPSREIYGRMDLSVATSEEGDKESAPSSPEPEPAPARRNPSSFTRGGGSGMPAGPAIDPSLVLKIGLGLGGVLVILLIIWIAKSLFGGSHPNNPTSAAQVRTATPAAAAQPAADSKAVITALDYVSVRVWAKGDGPNGYGEELLPNTVIKRGETASFNKSGPVIIWASQRENIQIVDASGRRWLPGSPSNGNLQGAGPMVIP